MKQEYNWATYGTGVIANQLAQALDTEGRKLYSVANRTLEKGKAFAEKYHISKVYDNPDDVFSDENVDIIYISTPHNTHAPMLKKALANGKHVLCEKSITLNTAELEIATELAQKNNVVLAEAMTIFHMPLYKELSKKSIREKLGALQLVQVNFGSYKDYDLTNRFFSRSLAGGAMLDIGVYALSFMRWFMSEAPNDIVSRVELAPTGVDEKACLMLSNTKQEMASITLSLHAKQPKRGLAVYEKGYIEVYEFPRADQAVITYTETGEKEVIEAGKTTNALVYEIHDMEAAVSSEQNVMHLDYSHDVMKIMTKCRSDWKLVYPEEE